ncbi:MAG: hypothetical protein K9N34_07390 [Candidatus Marinimicrobia bacterium]|nr:hypothetical protein [Candidatus Neomarinimicrobiota bacterium]MCF7840881.1 hypothetical protein [Candidatus Neomarinimicrobiota bacterium]
MSHAKITRVAWLVMLLLLGRVTMAGDFSIKFSQDTRVDDGPDSPNIVVRFLPEYFGQAGQFGNGLLDVDVAADLYFNLKTGTQSIQSPLDELLYRSWLRWSTSQLEIRLGKQELNFGPGRILRSLRWFDARDPLDPLSLTQGVWALTGRYYWLDNKNLWLWTIFNPRDLVMGIDLYPAEKRTFQQGGRFQIPQGSGNLAVTIHEKVLEGSDEPEWRIGLDGQWDVGVGIWFEAVRIVEPASQGIDWMNLITLGSDYTFGIGNGLYAVAEYQYLQSPNLNESVQTMVTQVNYPLGLMDQVFILALYNNTLHFSAYYTGWQRQYDRLSWQILAGYIDKKLTGVAMTPIAFIGQKSLQVTLMYTI